MKLHVSLGAFTCSKLEKKKKKTRAEFCKLKENFRFVHVILIHKNIFGIFLNNISFY